MANYRRNRINEEMQKEMMNILRGVKDPRVQDAFMSVTAVDVTPDLKYAKIYYSFLNGDEKELKTGLKAATGYIRRELARNFRRLRIRRCTARFGKNQRRAVRLRNASQALRRIARAC